MLCAAVISLGYLIHATNIPKRKAITVCFSTVSRRLGKRASGKSLQEK